MSMSGRKAKRTPEERAMNGARSQSIQKLEGMYAEPPPYSAEPPSAQASTSNTASSSSSSNPPATKLSFVPSTLEMPTTAECIAHLKLLHAFAKLRHDVGNSDGLYCISMEKMEKEEHRDATEAPSGHGKEQPQGVHGADAMIPSPEEEASTDIDATLAERVRDKRWSIFVHKAVARYERWWETQKETHGTFYTSIRQKDFDENNGGTSKLHHDCGKAQHANIQTVSRFPTEGDGNSYNATFWLPPLDVLMVWHAHMLNPRAYLEDCIRYTAHKLWRTSFPWEAINDSISDTTYEYNQLDTSTFTRMTGLPWDPLHDHNFKQLTCPRCIATIQAPWTRYIPTTSSAQALEAYLQYDTGYTSPSFAEPCQSCGLILTHERLRVGKFINDVVAVQRLSQPLAGTILNTWGSPGTTGKGKDTTTHDAFFPNRVVEKSSDFLPENLRAQTERLTVHGIRTMFEYAMKDNFRLSQINSGQHKPEFVAKESRVAVRKVLSHYWDNSGIHGLDLASAVLRQGTFVQKMRKLDWLHSPSLMQTAVRLIIKYHRMIQLAADFPAKTVVPTLDVDLAWHTHQLTPKVYYSYTLAEVKRFLNHDDKLPSSTLHEAFTWTSQAYEKRYGQPYAECSCWYCECTREPLRSSFLGKLSSRRASLSVVTLDEKKFGKHAATGVHVSAHNALPLADERSAAERRRELEELDLQYAKVLKRYQKEKKGDAAPRKEDRDAYLYGAYGYPIYYPMPVYVPYGADPACTAHVSGGGGGGGGCAAGTCCPSTSLGGCAGGTGTPGCKASCGGHGDASGGCGSCGGDGGGCGGCGG